MIKNKSKLNLKEKNGEFEEVNITYGLYLLKRTIDEFDELHKMYVEQIEENEQLKSEIKDLKFENETKYREIMQLEQMLRDVER